METSLKDSLPVRRVMAAQSNQRQKQVIRKHCALETTTPEAHNGNEARDQLPAIRKVPYGDGRLLAVYSSAAPSKHPALPNKANRIFLNKSKNLDRPSIRKVRCRIAAEAVDTAQRAKRRGGTNAYKTLEKALVGRIPSKVENEAAETARRCVWRRRVQLQRWALNNADKSIRRIRSKGRKELIEAAQRTAWRHRYRRRQRGVAFKRTRRGLLIKIVKGQQPILLRESSSLRKPVRNLGLRWQCRFAAKHKLQAAVQGQVEFSSWLEKLAPGETSGYKPLREPTGTASFFKETRARATVRELQGLDLSQADGS